MTPTSHQTATDAVALLMRRRQQFTAHDLDKMASLLHMDFALLTAVAWDLTEDGALTYDASGRFTVQTAS